MVRESKTKIEVKKNQYRKVIKASQKAKKWLSPKNKSKQKKQSLLEL